MKKNSGTQEALDQKIHTTIKKYCEIDIESIETDKALHAFDVLSKRASSDEIRAHKGEYVFLFSRVIHGLDPVSQDLVRPRQNKSVQIAPKVVGLTDWLIDQKGREDGLYKTRLKKLIQLIKSKNLPISSKKHQEWEKSLAPKRKISLRGFKVREPENAYRCVLFNRGINNRPCERN